jgi:uncharacterized protein YodC (DUF2158 family)
MKFSEGDVVSRKIGGPLMTVEDVRQDEFIACIWFDGEGHVQRDTFHPSILHKWILATE